MFFKRRSRANSYVDENSAPLARRSSEQYERYERPASESRTVSGHNAQVTSPDAVADPTVTADAKDMYPRPQAPQEAYGSTRMSSGNTGRLNSIPSHQSQPNLGMGAQTRTAPAPMPDLLAQAFNQALAPYTAQIEQLEQENQELRNWIESLENERKEVHAWIDKRGLRPDVPPSIARIMDSPTAESAHNLNAQLDRKITIVNFDLHRLQDDLNDSISSSHFADAMLKFLPDIARLSQLPTGPKYAFDLILKLGGNLNSHGGLDTGDEADLKARRDFYGKLDNAMVEVVRRRFAEQEDWMVGREIKRIQKTAEYVKSFGIEPYFPATMALMLREQEYRGATAGSVPTERMDRMSINGGAPGANSPTRGYQ